MQAFNEQIVLYDKTVGYGSSGTGTQTNKTTALCYFGNTGSIIALTAQASGTELSGEVIMWAAEYSGQRYAEISGKTYTVVSANKTGNALTVKLLLKRG